MHTPHHTILSRKGREDSYKEKLKFSWTKRRWESRSRGNGEVNKKNIETTSSLTQPQQHEMRIRINFLIVTIWTYIDIISVTNLKVSFHSRFVLPLSSLQIHFPFNSSLISSLHTPSYDMIRRYEDQLIPSRVLFFQPTKPNILLFFHFLTSIS